VVKVQDLPSNDGPEWLDLVVADSEGNPQRVRAIGVSIMLQNGEHVPVGLVRNGHRKAWKPA
jgi:hypothetical protein